MVNNTASRQAFIRDLIAGAHRLQATGVSGPSATVGQVGPGPLVMHQTDLSCHCLLAPGELRLGNGELACRLPLCLYAVHAVHGFIGDRLDCVGLSVWDHQPFLDRAR